MAYMIGMAVGGVVGMLLLSRLTLWMFKRLGDNERRILVAHAVAYVLAVGLGGLGYADGGPPRFLYAASVYGLPTLLWLAMDLLGLKGRRFKGQVSN
ncbi:hypothetical protein [Phenylobacterium hankyongense]|nr:hypothetical protein [Phenylobacterium hankyongense]